MGLFRSGTFPYFIFALLCGSTADAAFVFSSGSIHVATSAQSFSSVDTDSPPDVIMSNGFASHGTSSSAISGNGVSQSSVFTQISLTPGSISISGTTDFDKSSALIIDGSATASGTMVFNVTAPITLSGTFSFTGIHANAGVSIKDALNNTIFAQSRGVGPGSNPPPAVANFATPGLYTITWNHTSGAVVGTGGATSWNWSLIPEPAALALLLIPSVLLRRRLNR